MNDDHLSDTENLTDNVNKQSKDTRIIQSLELLSVEALEKTVFLSIK